MTKLEKLRAQRDAIEAEIKKLESGEVTQGRVRALLEDGDANILAIQKKDYYQESQRWCKVIEARNEGQLVMSIKDLIDDLTQVRQMIIDRGGEESDE